MIRNILAVFLGLALGMAWNMALIMLNSYVLFPMPEGMDMMNTEQMNAYVATLPTVALLVVLLAHLGQAYVGGWVAAYASASRPILLAMIVGVASLAGGVINMMSIQGPTWMYVELPLYLVLAWYAGRLAVQARNCRP
mgnify:CR=1 FL=1